MSVHNTDDLPRWIAELKAGNNQSLEILFERYGAYCLRTLRRRTGCSLQDAEDILQESVIVFRNNAIVGRITHSDNLKSYLYTICLNLYRAQAEKQVSQASRQQEVTERWYQDAATEHDAETYEHQVELVMSALDELRPSCQRLLRYFYLQGYSMQEIAEQMNLANANVAKNMKYHCLQCWTEKIQEMKRDVSEKIRK